MNDGPYTVLSKGRFLLHINLF